MVDKNHRNDGQFCGQSKSLMVLYLTSIIHFNLTSSVGLSVALQRGMIFTFETRLWWDRNDKLLLVKGLILRCFGEMREKRKRNRMTLRDNLELPGLKGDRS